ncbi:MAG: hypothetical protein WBD40_24415 [Tepidisphaeraceae bacterium]
MAEGIVAPPAYVPRLSNALQAALNGAQVTFERVRGDRYRFVVIAQEFDGQEHPQRQRTVWNVADGALPREDLLNVAMIITLSPTEV